VAYVGDLVVTVASNERCLDDPCLPTVDGCASARAVVRCRAAAASRGATFRPRPRL